MKPHRVFIAINLPGDIKEKLLEYKNKWPELPARWTTAENLHMTLAFLGNTSDQELAEICKLMEQVGERHSPFSVELNKITYGPPGKSFKMIWGVGDRTTELVGLRKDVENTLGQHESKPFSPHLTLACLKTFQLSRMEPEEIPEINEDISLSFQVNSIEVMESQLKRSGAQYTVCQSVPLEARNL